MIQCGGSGSNTAGWLLRNRVTDCQPPTWECSADERQRTNEVNFGHAFVVDDVLDACTRLGISCFSMNCAAMRSLARSW
jgi:hypothetical protein